MKQFLTFVILAALLYCLTGCAQYWYQEGKTYKQCVTDYKECQEELLKYTDENSTKIGGYETKFIEKCMMEKGYKAVTEDKLPLRVKRKDPPKWYMRGMAGTLEKE
jgi:hypothetical protein